MSCTVSCEIPLTKVILRYDASTFFDLYSKYVTQRKCTPSLKVDVKITRVNEITDEELLFQEKYRIAFAPENYCIQVTRTRKYDKSRGNNTGANYIIQEYDDLCLWNNKKRSSEPYPSTNVQDSNHLVYIWERIRNGLDSVTYDKLFDDERLVMLMGKDLADSMVIGQKINPTSMECDFSTTNATLGLDAERKGFVEALCKVMNLIGEKDLDKCMKHIKMTLSTTPESNKMHITLKFKMGDRFEIHLQQDATWKGGYVHDYKSYSFGEITYMLMNKGTTEAYFDFCRAHVQYVDPKLTKDLSNLSCKIVYLFSHPNASLIKGCLFRETEISKRRKLASGTKTLTSRESIEPGTQTFEAMLMELYYPSGW